MNYIVFLILIIVIGILLPSFLKMAKQRQVVPFSEAFENYTLEEAETAFSNPMLPSNNINNNNLDLDLENELLVEDEFPLTHRNGISNNGASNIWWHYPTFKVGSYKQITNNIRYSNNPDEGTCMPASMCGALYKERKHKSNYINPLPPINPDCGTRIGYFTTGVNLLPFRTDVPNILY